MDLGRFQLTNRIEWNGRAKPPQSGEALTSLLDVSTLTFSGLKGFVRSPAGNYCANMFDELEDCVVRT